MGPMFYLVQLKEARCLISAVILADWPHEFALGILLGKRAGGGCTPWPAAFSAGFFWGCAAKKARFLDPVQQPLNAITMAKASARKEEEERKEAGLRAPHRQAKQRGRAPGLGHLPGDVSLAAGAAGRAARADEEMQHRRTQASNTQR